MTRPAPHVAVRRRMAVLYMPALVAAAVMFLANYPVLNGGTFFGGISLLALVVAASWDLEKNL